MASYSWNVVGGGAWGTSTNWTPNGVPGNADTATVSQNITGAATITTGNLAAFPSSLSISDTDGSHIWTIGASGNTIALGGPLTLNTPVRSATVGYDVAFNPALNGSYPVKKTGPGIIVFASVAHTTTGFVVEDGGIAGGYIMYSAASGKYVEFGSASVIPTGTISYDSNSTPAQTVTFPIKFVRDTLLRNYNAGATTFSGPIEFTNGITLTVTAAGGATFSGALTGTAGFTKAGTGFLTLSGASPGLDTSVAGSELAVAGGTIYLQPASVIPNVSKIRVAYSGAPSSNPSSLWYFYTADTILNAGTTFTGDGLIVIYKNGASDPTTGMSFPAGALAGMTGTVHTINASGIVQSGLCIYAETHVANGRVCRVTTKDLPSLVQFTVGSTGAGSATTNILTYDGTGGTFATQVDVTAAVTSALITSGTYKLATTSSLVSPLILQGAVSCYGPSTSARTLTLGGASTLDNALQGVISNGVATGGLGIAKADAGKWLLSGANTYTGTTSISAGTLSAQSAGAFGTSGAVTQTGGTIEVTGGVALNKAGAALTLVSAAGANALTTTTGTNTLACAGITLSSTIIVDAAAGASLTVNNTAAMSGAFGITKNNSGEIGLGTFANTYTGAVTINAGTLTVGNLQNTSTASSLGTGALSSAIALTGTLKYNGTGHSTNRSITFTGSAPALDASGSGAVTYSACTQAAGARTITFTGSNTDANTLSAALSDGTGAVSVAKSGAGKWVLSNATLNYTGTTSVSDGTLNLGGVNRTLSGVVSISGGTIENSTNTLSANVTMTGGTITAQLTGNKTLDVDSGVATLEPTNNANDYTGATTVDAGATLRLITGVNPTLGGGKVLGDSNVDVSGNLKTYGSVTQKGQMRYGGNVTFQAGAKLYVGGA